jgi:pimeloyl-ACP methyl ester carboxylesterase
MQLPTSTTVLLLHGAMLDRRNLLSLAPFLPDDFVLLAPDLAGHGQRLDQWQHLERLDAPGLAQELWQRLPLGQLPGPLWLVGHSLGALVALYLADLLLAQPQSPPLGGLILGDPPFLPRDIPAAMQSQALASSHPVEELLVRQAFFGFHPVDAAGAPIDGPFFPQLQRLAQAGCGPIHVLLGLQPAFRREDGFSDCGTLVGEESRRRLLLLRDELPNATIKAGLHLHGVADAGHFVFHSAQGVGLVQQLIGQPS